MVFFTRRFLPVVGTSIGNLDVGTEITLNENGAPANYLIVNQGIPENSSLYDASCDGTWLLRKDIAENRQWNSSNVNDYANSTVHAYLNGDWLDRYDPDVAESIVQCKIPYRAGSGYETTVTSGASGLPAKIFLLSATEVSFNMRYMPTNEGAELSYFAGCADNGNDNKRIAYLNSLAIYWWLRSPYCDSNLGSALALNVNNNGNWYNNYCSSPGGIRPALVLPFSFKLADSQIVA